MTALTWHGVGTRIYENGVSHGVLYLPSGTGIAWNGLVSIDQEFNDETQPLYFDGMKLGDFVQPSDFKGSLKAITYPNEFEALTGMTDVSDGASYDAQRPHPFGLSWRSRINDDTGEDIGFKIHILWNVIAVLKSLTWQTLSDDPGLNPFEWSIGATPEELSEIRSSAHIVIDSREVLPEVIADVEEILYGSETEDASLPSGADFFDFISNWALLRIKDNLDGTWTATTASFNPEIITDLGGGEFEITDTNISVINSTTYTISSTVTEDDITP